MDKKVYWCGIEYKCQENKNLKGGFVYAFLYDYDVRSFLKSLLIELNDRDLNPVEVEFISPYDFDMEWETDEQTNHYINLYKEAENSDKIIFDEFYAYESDLKIS